MLHTTNFRTLQYHFGFSLVSLLTPSGLTPNTHLRLVTNHLPKQPVALLTVHLIARSPAAAKHTHTLRHTLLHSSPSDISPSGDTVLRLLPQIMTLPPSITRGKIMKTVSSTLYTCFHYRMRPRYTLRITFHPALSFPHIAAAFHHLCTTVHIDPRFIRYVMDHTSIVCTSNHKLSQILDNSAHHTKSFHRERPPPCSCRSHPLFHTYILHDQNHLHLRGNLYYGPYARPLHTTGKYTPTPDAPSIHPHILHAMHQLLKHICHRLPPSIPTLPTNLLTATTSSSVTHPDLGPPDLDLPPSVVPTPLSLSQATYARSLYGDIVITYMDRDLGCPFLSCPTAYWQALYDTFCNDPRHYTAVDDLSTEILIQRYMNHYINQGWSRYFPAQPPHKRALPGPARIIFKRKDTDIGLPRFSNPRARPIVPYRCHSRQSPTAHPLLQGLRLASVALSYFMSICPTHTWTLPSTQEFPHFITDIHRHLLNDPAMDIEYTPFDVKNMFTDLDKTHIRTAVKYFFTHPLIRQHEFVYIYKYSYTSHITFHPPAHHSKYYRIPITTLYQVICFDLDQSYFLVGTHIYKQVLGIPMGSFISATVAIATCAYSEDRAYHTLLASTRITSHNVFHGIRYVDDGILFTAIRRQSTTPPDHSPFRQTILDVLYPPPMTLELETYTSNFPLLESLCIPHGQYLIVRHHNKNISSIAATARPRLLSGIHSSTYRPAAYIRTTLIGDIIRIIRNTSPHRQYAYFLFLSLIEHLSERIIYQEVPPLTAIHSLYTVATTRDHPPHVSLCLRLAIQYIRLHRHDLFTPLLLLHYTHPLPFLPHPTAALPPLAT